MLDKGMDPEHDRETRRDFTQRVPLRLGDLAGKGKIARLGKGRELSGVYALKAIQRAALYASDSNKSDGSILFRRTFAARSMAVMADRQIPK